MWVCWLLEVPAALRLGVHRAISSRSALACRPRAGAGAPPTHPPLCGLSGGLVWSGAADGSIGVGGGVGGGVEESGGSVVGVPVPDRGRQARADGELIAKWKPSSSAAGKESRYHTHLGEALISEGRLLVENASEWSLNSTRGLQSGGGRVALWLEHWTSNRKVAKSGYKKGTKSVILPLNRQLTHCS